MHDRNTTSGASTIFPVYRKSKSYEISSNEDGDVDGAEMVRVEHDVRRTQGSLKPRLPLLRLVQALLGSDHQQVCNSLSHGTFSLSKKATLTNKSYDSKDLKVIELFIETEEVRRFCCENVLSVLGSVLVYNILRQIG